MVREGRAHAALVYDGVDCAGWCQFGSPRELPRIHNSRAYSATEPIVPDWRITCFFSGKGYRGKGVAFAALQGAIEQIGKLGGGRAEGYPEDIAGRKASPAFLFNGALSTFESLGFERARLIGKHKWVVTKTHCVGGLSDERGALFVNPGRPISPETMAVHHILDAQVAGAPFWKTGAPEILRPSGGVLALAAHRATVEQRFCRPGLTGGTAWICTWKSALRAWPHLPRFSNQALRYQRRPDGLDHGLPAHRAMPGAYVTAHHLRDLLNEASLERLVHWSLAPGLLPRVPAGPCRGRAWRDLGLDDVRVLSGEHDADVWFSAQTELRRRGEFKAPQAVGTVQGALV